MRDEFSKSTIEESAKRVGYRCSNPNCRAATVGPTSDEGGFVNLGEAAHITAAAPGGPRFDPTVYSFERQSGDNSIWLCRRCARLIDRDHRQYTVDLLRDWRNEAEATAKYELGGSSNVGLIRIGATLHITGQIDLIHAFGCPGLCLVLTSRGSQSVKIKEVMLVLQGFNFLDLAEQAFDGTFGYEKPADHNPLGDLFYLLLPELTPRNHPNGFVVASDELAKFYIPMLFPHREMFVNLDSSRVSIQVRNFKEERVMVLDGEEFQSRFADLCRVNDTGQYGLCAQLKFGGETKSATPSNVSNVGRVNTRSIK